MPTINNFLNQLFISIETHPEVNTFSDHWVLTERNIGKVNWETEPVDDVSEELHAFCNRLGGLFSHASTGDGNFLLSLIKNEINKFQNIINDNQHLFRGPDDQRTINRVNNVFGELIRFKVELFAGTTFLRIGENVYFKSDVSSPCFSYDHPYRFKTEAPYLEDIFKELTFVAENLYKLLIYIYSDRTLAIMDRPVFPSDALIKHLFELITPKDE